MHDQRAAAECECCQAEQANTAWTDHCEGQTAALAQQQQQQCSAVQARAAELCAALTAVVGAVQRACWLLDYCAA